MECKYCKERTDKELETYLSEPRCAFDSSNRNNNGEISFNKDNYACGTMLKLLSIAVKTSRYERNDITSGTIAYIPFENNITSGYLVITLYKMAGSIGSTMIVNDDRPVKELSLSLAYAIIDEYKRRGIID